MNRLFYIFTIGYVVILFNSFSAMADDITFGEFAELKSSVGDVGEIIGQLRACEAANSGRIYGSDALLDRVNDSMSKTNISFEILEKLSDAMLAAATSEENSKSWILELKSYDDGVYTMSTCEIGDVCCLVASDARVFGNRSEELFSKYYK